MRHWWIWIAMAACSPGPKLDTSGRSIMIVSPPDASCSACEKAKRAGERVRTCRPDWEFHERDHYKQKSFPPPGLSSIDARLGPMAWNVVFCAFEVAP